MTCHSSLGGQGLAGGRNISLYALRHGWVMLAPTYPLKSTPLRRGISFGGQNGRRRRGCPGFADSALYAFERRITLVLNPRPRIVARWLTGRSLRFARLEPRGRKGNARQKQGAPNY
ncbi:hypothetical protein [Sphingobium sp. MK2]|uniref:hypothetical protein n=1 Tax=Sphingobium sp. MK2 TaxID=3116540 RepID=UPI0032E360E4